MRRFYANSINSAACRWVTVLTGLTGWNMLVLLHISPLLLDNMYPPMLVLVLMMLILN
jgi:hypothetical protein